MSDKTTDTSNANWSKWHNGVKKELERLISKGAESEKTCHIGEEKSWGHLDSYKPDITWRKDGQLSFFEAEYYYQQEKIIGDIMYSVILGANQLTIIFGNEEYNGWNGERRVQAAQYLAELLLSKLSKPPVVKCVSVGNPEELEEKLKQAKIL